MPTARPSVDGGGGDTGVALDVGRVDGPRGDGHEDDAASSRRVPASASRSGLRPWQGAGVTAGWVHGGAVTLVSKDRLWTVRISDGARLRSGWLAELSPWRDAPAVDGQRPWRGLGVTAAWVHGDTLGLSSGRRYWMLDLRSQRWVGSGRYDKLPASHLLSAAQPLRCHRYYEGVSVSAGWIHDGVVTVISGDRFWRLRLSDKRQLEAGLLSRLPASHQLGGAPPAAGRYPWQGRGVTAAWVHDGLLGLSSGDRYWTLRLSDNRWVGAGRYGALPSSHLLVKGAPPILGVCAAAQRRCSAGVVQRCDVHGRWRLLLRCPADHRCSAGRCVRAAGAASEQTRLTLRSPSQLHGWFGPDHRAVTTTSALPATVGTLLAGVLTLRRRGGVIIANPARAARFYRVEVELRDDGQRDLRSFLTVVDRLWRNGQRTEGLSVGVDTASSPSTYWYDHTGFSEAGLSTAQRDFSRRYKSRFVARRSGWIKIAIYVTPAGVYAVVDGANYSSFPRLYSGSYTFRPTRSLDYIVLGKWSDAAGAVTWRNLRVSTLDDSPASVPAVNAHFIKRAAEDGRFLALVSDAADDTTGGRSFGQALWAALLYRGYDHYFGTDHRDRVRAHYDAYLARLRGDVEAGLARYRCGENTVAINHSFINSRQADPNVTLALRSYLGAARISRARALYRAALDAALARVRADGSFPPRQGYRADTFAEELSWLLSFGAGTYALTPPSDRRQRTRDLLAFLGFHHLADGRSIADVYGAGAVKLSTLPAAFRTFRSQTIWRDGRIDNHGFSPSLNYASGVVGSAAVARSALARAGLTVATLSHNLARVYQRSVVGVLDVARLRHRAAVPSWTLTCSGAACQRGGERCDNGRDDDGDGAADCADSDCAAVCALRVQQDHYQLDSAGRIARFSGRTQPSRVEDWGNVFSAYNVPEALDDRALADRVARRIYYLHYEGSGLLFCTASGCSAGGDNTYNFNFRTALYAMLFSPRSPFPF